VTCSSACSLRKEQTARWQPGTLSSTAGHSA
jgi:hypothetical protein